MFTCPKCERQIKYENQWHYCAKVDIDSLFEGKADELVLIFDKVLVEVAEWDNVIVSATKNCIVFSRNKGFLIVRPMQKMIDLKFFSEERLSGWLIHKSEAYNSKYENHIRLTNAEEVLPEVFKHLRHSYQIS
jgi:hypothetical protein